MDLLKDIFPQHSTEVLQNVLEGCNFDLDAAMATLLSPEFDSLNTNNQANEPNLVEPQAIPKQDTSFGSQWTNTGLRSVGRSLKRAIDDEQFSDVILSCVDGNEIFAHEVILTCRSEYFSVLLSTVDPLPELQNRKKLEIEFPKDLILLVLKYLYHDYISFKEEQIPDLHAAASFFELRRLRAVCEGGNVPPSTYPEDLLSVLENPDMFKHDVIIESDGCEYHANRLILCHGSQYFHDMLNSNFVEHSKNRISIPNLSSSELKLILECIYTDGWIRKGLINHENAFSHFLLGNEFMLPCLQNFTENFISSNLDLDNVCEVLVEGGRLSSSLRKICLEFITSNYDDVVQSQTYRDLPTLHKLEVDHFIAQKNESALIAIASALAGIDVRDLQSLIKDEVSEFFDERLSYVKIDDQVGSTDSLSGIIDYTISDIRLYPPVALPINKDVDQEAKKSKKEENKKENKRQVRPPLINRPNHYTRPIDQYRLESSDSDDDSIHTSSSLSSSLSSSSSSLSSSSEFEGQYFTKDDVSTSVTAKKLSIVISNVSVRVKDARWSFVQHSFPTVEDHGTLDADLIGIRLALSFDIIPGESGMPRLDLGLFSVDIDDVFVTLSEPKADWIYNILVKAFKSTLKSTVVASTMSSIERSLAHFTSQINAIDEKARRF